MIDIKLVVLVAVLLFVFFSWSCSCNTDNKEPFYNDLAEGDLVLRNLYRRIHNLEAVSRLEVAQNNDFAGGGHGISKERLVMEHIARETARLKGLARKEIARRRIPARLRNKPPLGYGFQDCYYDDCQLKMDHNERILGVPSVPGNTHSYYYNRDYETSRIPNIQQDAEDYHMV